MHSGDLAGVSFRSGMGMSVNTLAKALCATAFHEDEERWKKKYNAEPPFLSVALGPTESHTTGGGWIDDRAETIWTADSFGNAKWQLKELEKAVLPRLLTALSLRFSSEPSPVRFKLVARIAYGITDSGRRLLDQRHTITANLTHANGLDATAIHATLDDAAKLALQLHPDSARCYNLALEEEDGLKRFRYFFLTMEIRTNAVFDHLHDSAFFGTVVTSSSPLKTSLRKVFDGWRTKFDSLEQRFILCATRARQGVTDAGVNEFRRFKKSVTALRTGPRKFHQRKRFDWSKRLRLSFSGSRQ